MTTLQVTLLPGWANCLKLAVKSLNDFEKHLKSMLKTFRKTYSTIGNAELHFNKITETLAEIVLCEEEKNDLSDDNRNDQKATVKKN